MYRDKRVLCVIPARGGSKGVPRKNIREIMGKPLIAYSIEQALAAGCIDRVIVSTEDAEIALVSKQAGAEVPFVRPAELAADDSSGMDVLLHAADWMETEGNYPFDILVALLATSPLRDVEDIEKCVEMLVESGADNIITGTEAHRNPYFNMVEAAGPWVRLVKEAKFVTRQAAPKVYDMNASIYVWRKDVMKEKKSVFLEKTAIYEMPKERSVDIDDHLDLRIVEMLMKEKFGSTC